MCKYNKGNSHLRRNVHAKKNFLVVSNNIFFYEELNTQKQVLDGVNDATLLDKLSMS
jgi:hypothetical protein